MTRALFLSLAAAATLASGCSKETQVFGSLYSEAGSDVQTDDFGQSVATNTAQMTTQQNYAIDLTRKFGADVPPIVNFAFNSSALDAQAQQILMKQASWIKQFPEVRFRVYGYTDLVGTAGYNKALGMRRAQTVVNFLVSQGISRSRLEAVVSFGKTHPLVFTQGPERANRRAVTEVSGFVQSSKLVLNGKYAAIIFREYVNSAQPLPQTQTQSGAGGTASGT
jgi:outer membrane protein OmpA-like peptidoglycan-associated protein